MRVAIQPLHRAGQLAVIIILLSILAGMLFGSFSLIVPVSAWTVWRLPILIATGGAVALLMAWASSCPSRPGVIDGTALVLGLSSAVVGLACGLLITFGLNLQIVAHRGTMESLLYVLTYPALLWQLGQFAIIPAVPGIVGLWVARRRLRQVGRISLAGVAARSSTLGLALSAAIGIMAVSGAICHRVMWP